MQTYKAVPSTKVEILQSCNHLLAQLEQLLLGQLIAGAWLRKPGHFRLPGLQQGLQATGTSLSEPFA